MDCKMLLLGALSLGWLFCGFPAVHESKFGVNAASTKDNPSRDTCKRIPVVYDIQESVCCEDRLHPGAGLQCCGKQAFNPGDATCCQGLRRKGKITKGLSQKVSACCGLRAYNPLNEICCDGSTVVVKTGPKANCCGKVSYDEETHICCGKNIAVRESRNHRCCKNDQFNIETECCCWENESLSVQPFDSECCIKEWRRIKVPVHQGFQMKERGTEPSCTEPKSRHCGSTCYNPLTQSCCRKNLTHHRHAPGGCNTSPKPFNLTTHICCDGCVSARDPWTDQCCGERAYGLAQRGVLCCGGTLYPGREDGEECSDSGVPYSPADGTVCRSSFHSSPGIHCCGIESYQPQAEICCNGHRRPIKEKSHCCGVQAYSINDTQMKCCAGTLHSLTALGEDGADVRCCGSVLMTNTLNVCCSSEGEELLYSAQTGFRCCGHAYYNTSLWSCCAGRLRPAGDLTPRHSNTATESRFLSVNNLNELNLCYGMQVGIVESVSTSGIVWSSVLKVHGRNATVTPLASPYSLRVPDRCDSPKLTPGRTYFFDEDSLSFFTDSNHHSVLQSLHFIISKCYLS